MSFGPLNSLEPKRKQDMLSYTKNVTIIVIHTYKSMFPINFHVFIITTYHIFPTKFGMLIMVT